MCTSRLHKVVSGPDAATVLVEDVTGRTRRVSLLALDPPEPLPMPGDWLVMHSGYAVGRADTTEAESVLADLRPGPGPGTGAGPSR